MTTVLFLSFLGSVILLGFLGNLFYERTRMPDILILMAIGALIGHHLSPEIQHLIFRFAPFFGTLALIMILFEGGTDLDPDETFRRVPVAGILAVLSFGLSAVVTAVTMRVILAWGWIEAAILSAIIGCTSSAIVLPLAGRMRVADRVKTIVSLDAVLSDTLGAVAVFALVDVALSGLHHPALILRHLGLSVAIGAVGAIGVGIVWLNVLDLTRERPLSYLLTFAVLLLLYALVEVWHGSGPIAILLFGLLTSNIDSLPAWLRVRSFLADAATPEAAADETVRWFHTELTFLVRTFFFVYIGMLFRVEYLQGLVLSVSALLTAGLLERRTPSAAAPHDPTRL